jgi:hypothetical protein
MRIVRSLELTPLGHVVDRRAKMVHLFSKALMSGGITHLLHCRLLR